MESIINLCQEQAYQALAAMQKALQEYEETLDNDWLEISLEYEISAYRYLALAEQVLELI